MSRLQPSFCLFFFFSSRRRHTRFDCDWSSDVCSSDLASVDVVISNCVINLSADKRRVLAEAFRVLKPGGRFAVSDVVVRGALPAAVRRDMELWVGCVAGALEEVEYRRLLSEVGFEGIGVEPTRIYE